MGAVAEAGLWNCVPRGWGSGSFPEGTGAWGRQSSEGLGFCLDWKGPCATGRPLPWGGASREIDGFREVADGTAPREQDGRPGEPGHPGAAANAGLFLLERHIWETPRPGLGWRKALSWERRAQLSPDSVNNTCFPTSNLHPTPKGTDR